MTLRVEGIGKQYLPPPWYLRPVIRAAMSEPVDALRDVSFSVESGEVVGLIGPNGAGKTTLLKIVSTLLVPTAGSVVLDGIDAVASPERALRRLGLLLTEDRSTYWRLSGRSNLEFFGVLAGLKPDVARARADELLARMGLADRDRRVMGYSSGMRSALGIARAIIAEPSLIVLDEPTRSLDPLAAVQVGTMLREQAAAGRSVLLSSHRMDEVAAVCDRVILIFDGSVRYCGPADVGGQGDAARNLLALLTRETGAVVNDDGGAGERVRPDGRDRPARLRDRTVVPVRDVRALRRDPVDGRDLLLHRPDRRPRPPRSVPRRLLRVRDGGAPGGDRLGRRPRQLHRDHPERAGRRDARGAPGDADLAAHAVRGRLDRPRRPGADRDEPHLRRRDRGRCPLRGVRHGDGALRAAADPGGVRGRSARYRPRSSCSASGAIPSRP